MVKKPSKRHKQIEAVTGPGEHAPQCPYCATTRTDKFALSLLEQLFQSHAELSAVLRLAGRQMLRFEMQGHESLERIRKALKRADNIRDALISSGERTQAGKKPLELRVDARTQFSEQASEQVSSDRPIRKSPQKSPGRKNRPGSPDPQRIFKLPG
jgi:hypothetical protein